MAITDKEYSEIYNITSSQQTALEAVHAEGHIGYLALHPEDNPFIAGVLKEIKDLQKELDYLRTEISANKDKTTFPGLGTSSTTALAGDTKLVGIGSNTTLSFGDLTATTVKGKTTYTIVLQATRNFGGKTGLVTKSATITLT